MRNFGDIQVCPHCGKPIDSRPKYVSINEAASMLSLARITVYRHREELGGVKRFGKWLFSVGRIEKFINVRK